MGTLAGGRVLGGRYRLTEELARGGMATVWVAEDPMLSRRVAVKILHPELALDESLRTRFRQEAVAAARLTHPGIVATYDTGDDDGTAYIVMQLVEGPTLRRLLDERAPLPVGTALDIAAQVADALDHAHGHGLVHRDVKPANVLVPDDGRVRVTDFGIAKAAGGEDLTRSGTVVGTARYLAPEQVSGAAVDGRADVYALGLVLYEMLTATLPFAGDTEVATAMARLTTDPEPARARRPDVPPMVDVAVSRSLARDPDDRFASAQEFRHALEPALDSSNGPLTLARVPAGAGADTDRTLAVDRTAPTPVPAAPPPAPAHPRQSTVASPRRWPGALLVLVLVAALAVGGVFAFSALRDDGGGGGDEPSAAPGPIPIVDATAFDPPPGDGEENGDRAALAFDGNPATAWETQSYSNRTFGNLKPGVGLVFELGEDRDIRSVTVQADDEGWDAEIYVSDQQGGDLAAWGAPVGSGQGLGRSADIPVDEGGRGRFVLLWFTHLPPDLKLNVAEVTIAG